MENLSWHRLQMQMQIQNLINMHIPYINNTSRKSINYPNIPYPKVPPHFSLFLSLPRSLHRMRLC